MKVDAFSPPVSLGRAIVSASSQLWTDFFIYLFFCRMHAIDKKKTWKAPTKVKEEAMGGDRVEACVMNSVLNKVV